MNNCRSGGSVYHLVDKSLVHRPNLYTKSNAELGAPTDPWNRLSRLQVSNPVSGKVAMKSIPDGEEVAGDCLHVCLDSPTVLDNKTPLPLNFIERRS